MHEKGQKGEENSDVISPKQLLCFLVTLANKPCMNGGGPGGGKKHLSPTGGAKTNQLNQPADSQERPDKAGKHANSTTRPALASANEAERGKG